MIEREISIMDSGEAQLSLQELFSTIELLTSVPNPKKELLEQLEARLEEESEMIEACGTDITADEYFGIDDALNHLMDAYRRIGS